MQLIKEEKIKNYIEKANKAIESIKKKRRIEIVEKSISKIKEKREKIEKELGIEGKFLISSDYPQNDEDIEILKNVLKIDEKIVYLTNDMNKVIKLKKFFHDRLIEIKEDLYVIAFMVNIHILFYDNILLQLLQEYGRKFWPVHPNNSPINQFPELPKSYLENDKEFLKFMCGDYYKEINSIYDWVNFWFGDFLTNDEIKEYLKTCSRDLFFLKLKYAVNKKGFLEKLYKLRKKIYEWNLRCLFLKNYRKNHKTKLFIDTLERIYNE